MAYIGAKPTDIPLTGADIEDGTVQIADLAATGTKDATTFLRGDGTFASAGGVNTPAFSATITSSQAINNATVTKVSFDSEIYDTNSAYDTTNKRFTVPSGEAGKYYFYSNVMMLNAVDADIHIIYLYQNGSALKQVKIGIGRADDNSTQISAIVDASVGDYFEIFYYHNMGAGKSIAQSLFNTQFLGYKIIE